MSFNLRLVEGLKDVAKIARAQRAAGLSGLAGLGEISADDWHYQCTHNPAPVECFSAAGVLRTQTTTQARYNAEYNADVKEAFDVAYNNWQLNDGYRWVNNVWTKTTEPPPPPLYRSTDPDEVFQHYLTGAVESDPAYTQHLQPYYLGGGITTVTGANQVMLPQSGQGPADYGTVNAPSAYRTTTTTTPPAPASAPQGTGAAGPLNIEIRNLSRSSGYVVGDKWEVRITGAPPNAQVSWTSSQNGQSRGTGTQGNTDAAGNFSLSGQFAADHAGSWSQTWRAGAKSGQLSFIVVPQAGAGQPQPQQQQQQPPGGQQIQNPLARETGSLLDPETAAKLPAWLRETPVYVWAIAAAGLLLFKGRR